MAKKNQKNQLKSGKKQFSPTKQTGKRKKYDETQISKMKEEIHDILYPKQDIKNVENEMPKLEEPNDYFIHYKKYLEEDFSQRIVSMVINYINTSECPEELKNQENFINTFILLVKRLLMTEMEVAVFTLIIDKCGWNHPQNTIWKMLTFYGAAAKTLFGEEDLTYFLLTHTMEYDNFNEDYLKWLNDGNNSDLTSGSNEFFMRVNKRHQELTKITNTYCKKNYVDLNGVVDQIIKLSQPYNATSVKPKKNELEELIRPMTNNLKENKEPDKGKVIPSNSNLIKNLMSEEHFPGVKHSVNLADGLNPFNSQRLASQQNFMERQSKDPLFGILSSRQSSFMNNVDGFQEYNYFNSSLNFVNSSSFMGKKN